nr:DNA mismatch endonuclease Vsr [Desulfobacula sp.]
MDVFSKEKRSRIMSRIGGKDTKPELLVRSLLHSMGYRFRIQRKDLPGNPDIILPKYKKVIFVHGCFWHGHAGCSRSKRPDTNMEFWNKKIDGNMERDKYNIQRLEDSGWMTLTLWTCEIKDQEALKNRLLSFLETDQHKQETLN